MREIDFQGRDRHGRWWSSESLRSVANGDLYAYIYDRDFISHEVEPETVAQYTELDDDHGVRIYEHDLIRVSYPKSDELGPYLEPKIYKIIFKAGAFYAEALDGQLTLLGDFYEQELSGEIMPLIIVIGNIHDNPELMEVAK